MGDWGRLWEEASKLANTVFFRGQRPPLKSRHPGFTLTASLVSDFSGNMSSSLDRYYQRPWADFAEEGTKAKCRQGLSGEVLGAVSLQGTGS